jgi:hypothetical protein
MFSDRGIQTMQIRLTARQEAAVLAWAGEIAAAEVAADCEPSGYEIVVAISPYGTSATATAGSRSLDLGDVEVLLSSDAGDSGVRR